MRNSLKIHIGLLFGILLLFIYLYSSSIFPMVLNAEIAVFQYAVLLLIVMLVMILKKIRYRKLLIPLFIASFLSILFNDIPEFFSPYSRFFAWILLVLAVGPVFKNDISVKTREYIFFVFPRACLVITVLSFIYWALGFPVIGRGDFTGIMRHAMILSPLACISIMYTFAEFLTHKSIKLSKYKWALLFGVSVFVALLGGSRSALMSSFIGMIVIFHGYSKKQFYTILMLVLFLIPIFFISQNIFDSNQNTEQTEVLRNIGKKGTKNSRSELWADRINEFLYNPVFGSGFGAVDIEVIEKKRYNEESGTVESGSGYLSIMSMLGTLGVLGFLYFLIPIISKMRRRVSSLDNNTNILVIIYTCFFSVHLIFEGYIFAVGSLLGLILWVVLGYFSDLSDNKQKTG